MKRDVVSTKPGQMILSSIVSSLIKKPNFIAFLLCLIVGAIYFHCAVSITRNIFTPTDSNYYIYLLDALSHGYTNIIPIVYHDLSLFENKWYMYWGPAPVLLILPFYVLFRLQASDVLYTAIAGIVNVVLFYFVMQEFKKFFHLSLSLVAEAFLLLSFGLASPNFFLSVAGTVWFTAQIFAVTYLLLFYLFYFRFLNGNKHSQLILCMVFLCLACLSRYTLLFNGLLFIYVFGYCKMSGRTIPTKIILSLTLLVLAFVSLEALYNFLRFHNVFETGLRFQLVDVQVDARLKSNQILSIRYVYYNMYYCFINVLHLSNDIPYVIVDKNGNSVFSVYPALLLLPVLFCKRKYVNKRGTSFLLLAGIVIGLNLLSIMLYLATGWFQLGYRYFFDLLPLVFLLLIFILPSIPLIIQMVLLSYGIFVNFYGIIAFYGISNNDLQLQEPLFWIVLLLSTISFLSTERFEGISQ